MVSSFKYLMISFHGLDTPPPPQMHSWFVSYLQRGSHLVIVKWNSSPMGPLKIVSIWAFTSCSYYQHACDWKGRTRLWMAAVGFLCRHWLSLEQVMPHYGTRPQYVTTRQALGMWHTWGLNLSLMHAAGSISKKGEAGCESVVKMICQ